MEITADELIDVLTSLPFDLKGEYQQSITKVMNTHGSLDSISKVFHSIINAHVTFLDYGILEHLISNFGSAQLKRDMDAYVVDITNFKRETSLEELIDHWPGKEDATLDYAEIRARFGLDPIKSKLFELDSFRRNFCSRYHLSEFVMALISVRRGSFIAVWRIPTVLVDQVIESTSQMDNRFFDNENVLEMSVAGQQIHPLSSRAGTAIEVSIS